jgi:hypothetical protein
VADIYLPQSKGVDIDGYAIWRITLDHGFFTSREQVEAWISERDDPAEWDWEECSPSSFPPADAASVEADTPRDGVRRIVSAHVYDGGHGALDARQVDEMVADITDAVLDEYDLTAKGTTEAE